MLARAVLALLVADTAHEIREWGRVQQSLGALSAPAANEAWTSQIAAQPQPAAQPSRPQPVAQPAPQAASRPVVVAPAVPASEAPQNAVQPAQRSTTANATLSLFASLRQAKQADQRVTSANKPEAKHKLDENIRNCRMCSLGRRRENVLCGYGPLDAKLMFVFAGGNPHELAQGHVLTGEAETMMNGIIAALTAISPHAAKDRIYFTNVLKCEAIPAPQLKKECTRACLANLREEVRIVQPEVIVVFGQTAYSAMFGDDTNIISVRGQIRRFEQIITIPTHHPMELVKNKQLKRPVWNDVREALHQLKS